MGVTKRTNASGFTFVATDGAVTKPLHTDVSRDAITGPTEGMEIYNTDDSIPQFYNGSAWTTVAAGGVHQKIQNGTTSVDIPVVNSDVIVTTAGSEVARFLATGTFVVGASTGTASALVQIDSVSQGFLGPRMSEAQRDAISAPAAGLQIYNTTTNMIDFYDGTSWVTPDTGATPTQIVNGTSDVTIATPNADIVFTAGGIEEGRLTQEGNVVMGEGHTIDGDNNVILGRANIIRDTSSVDNTILGGTNNVIGPTAAANATRYNVIAGGQNHTIGDAVTFSSILGGELNKIADSYSFVAGRNMTVNSTRSFVVGFNNIETVVDQDYSAIFFPDENGRMVVGAGTSDAASALEVTSTTRGFLMPRMTTTQRDAISTPPTGLEVFNTTTGQHEYYTGAAWASSVNTATDLSTTQTATTVDVVSSDGTDATLPQAIASGNAGVMSGADKSKLDGIEALADVTDATNVNAAGAIMDTDLTTAGDIIVRNATVPTRLAVGANGQRIVADSGEANGIKWSDEKGVLGITIDGGGVAITTGQKKYLRIPYACEITVAELVADVSGSIVIDVWKDTYANYPPTVADTITAAAKPTLSTAIKSTDATLTGWTKTLAEGDYLGFNVDSATTVTWAHLSLGVKRTA